ncbi:MAG: orotidine-5'-phosphate decarboxylase [Oscillospiraceae bacterium]|nr:orotidine-5'-phosphate decarboxylase [Oscillospiraceae bacterium]
MRDVIIACDFPGEEECLRFLEAFRGKQPFLKIGMELFYAAGPSLVRKLKEEGYSVFLDLKLHDIPNTVRSAMRVLAGLGVDMVNVHAAGTRAMMEAAREGLGSETKLLAVTQLTSTDEARMRKELLIVHPLEEVVLHYARNAAAAGLDGVVCSPLEAAGVHGACGEGFLTVTPGIRFATDAVGDQVRVTTPAMARELGSDYIVVGRPITRAADPVAAWEQCRRDFLAQ